MVLFFTTASLESSWNIGRFVCVSPLWHSTPGLIVWVVGVIWPYFSTFVIGGWRRRGAQKWEHRSTVEQLILLKYSAAHNVASRPVKFVVAHGCLPFQHNPGSTLLHCWDATRWGAFPDQLVIGIGHFTCSTQYRSLAVHKWQNYIYENMD